MDIITQLINLMDMRKSTNDIYYHIAKTILLHADEIPGLGIEELARLCYTSPATISRFCRKISLASYADLKRSIREMNDYTKQEVQFTPEERHSISSNKRWLAEKTFPMTIHALEETYRLLDLKVIDQVVQAIYRAPRLAIFGGIYSQLVARDFQYKFIRLEKFTTAFTEQSDQQQDIDSLTPDAVAVFFSVSGELPLINQFCTQARAAGATTVAITNNRLSTLAQHADFVIQVGGKESDFTQSSISGRIALMSVVDFLYTSYAYRKQQ